MNSGIGRSGKILRRVVGRARTVPKPLHSIFWTAIERNYPEAHIVDRLLLDPSIAAMRRLTSITRKIHVGHVDADAAYVLLAMLFVLVTGQESFGLAKA